MVGVAHAQWVVRLPVINATQVRFSAGKVGELGLRPLSEVGFSPGTPVSSPSERRQNLPLEFR